MIQCLVRAFAIASLGTLLPGVRVTGLCPQIPKVPPELPRHKVPNCTEHAEGDTCKMYCIEGSKIVTKGSQEFGEITCGKRGWTGMREFNCTEATNIEEPSETPRTAEEEKNSCPEAITFKSLNIEESTCTQISFGQTCEVNCKDGFISTNGLTQRILCQESGSWEDPAVCSKIQCPDPPSYDEQNEEVGTCSSRTIGTNCDLRCVEGYKYNPPGKNMIECTLDSDSNTARWAKRGQRTCEQIRCPSAQSYNEQNEEVGACSSRTIGTSCTLRCAAGYKYTKNTLDSNRIVCSLDRYSNTASWVKRGQRTCEQIKCDSSNFASIENLDSSQCSSVNTGASCDLRCNTNYKFYRRNQPITIRCLLSGSQGVWDIATRDIPRCEELLCPDPPSFNGRNEEVETCSSQTIGTNCDLRCVEGYRYGYTRNTLENNRIVCRLDSDGNAASWVKRGQRTCERIQCRASEFNSINKLDVSNCRNVETGTSCALRCDRGYKFADGTKNVQLRCHLRGSSGVWNTTADEIANCEMITCPNITSAFPTAFSSSTIIPSVQAGHCKFERMRFDSTCELTCPEGYEFEKGGENRKSIFCDYATESWSPSIQSLGICTVKLIKVESCNYWLSGVEANGAANARQRCKTILGETSELAMPKSGDAKRKTKPLSYHFVGARVNNTSTSWDDHDEIGALKFGSGECVALWYETLYRAKCTSQHLFMCELPEDSYDPCQINPCKSNGTCVPYGCRFKCQCKEKYFGHICEEGPFKISINVTKDGKSILVNYSVKSNEVEGRFDLFINGEKRVNITNISKKRVKGSYDQDIGKHDVYVSGKAYIENAAGSASYKCKRLKIRDATKPANVTKSLCNSTNLKVKWIGLGTDATSAISYDIYANDSFKGTSADKDYTISGLEPATSYKITIVPHLEGCKEELKLFKGIRRKTGEKPAGPPKVKLPDSVLEYSSICNITWRNASERIGKKFQVKITELMKSSFDTGQRAPSNAIPEQFDVNGTTYNHPTSPNSIYEVAVGTKPIDVCRNILPISWSNVTHGCRTDSAPPNAVPIPVTVTQNSADGTVSMELDSVDERNGKVSCYLVIVQKINATDKSNSTSLPPADIEDSNAPNGTVEIGRSYIAAALTRFEGKKKVTLGDGETTCCNMRGLNESCGEATRRRRAIDSVVNGENLELERSSEYRHYIIVSTPTSGDPAKVASRWSDPWSVGADGNEEDNLALAIALPIILVILLALVIAGFILYRRKYAKSKAHPVLEQRALRPINRRSHNEDSVIDARRGEVNTDDVIESNLGKYSFELSNLYQIMDEKRADEDMMFLKEFKGEIKTTIAQCGLTWDISQLPANKPKNRYKNIVPYDNDRVILEKQSGRQFSDYINAAYIDGYNFPQKFIAAQGPLPGTIGEFWRMIWEQSCYCIAMLTNIVEKNKSKCAQYWPDEEGITQVHGEIGVTWKETANYGDYIRRKMQISRNGETRSIFQFHFIAWPDHGIPNTTSSIMRFHKAVTHSQPQYAGPILVHCSAGVGRTGTFIGLDILSQTITYTENINVCAVVAKMRVKRPEMVQTLDQYILLHKLVLELYQFGETDVDVSGFNEAYQNLKRVSRGRSEISQEFDMLDYFLPLETSMDTAQKSTNTHLNRDLSVLPYDHNVAFIQMNPTDKAVPYFNASTIDSYHPDYKFVAAQTPDEGSVEMFWRIAIDNDVSMIVTLCEQKEKANYCYWPKLSEEARYGSISVRTLEEITEMGLTERKFEVTNKVKKVTMTQIVYYNWAENVAPASSGIVLEIVAKVEKHHQSISSSGMKATLVHCSDGSGRSGTFCAISNLIERLKNENRIDVFRTVKDLRDQRRMMVKYEGQYEFCYQSVSEFLKSFDLYGNFQ